MKQKEPLWLEYLRTPPHRKAERNQWDQEDYRPGLNLAVHEGW